MSGSDVDATRRDAPPRADHVDLRLAPGTLLGRYIVLEELGAGGMGVVYAAYDPELNRNVAIKLVHTSRGETGYEAWLLREAQAMAQLAHPNVITVHDVGTLPSDSAGERVFVAMELVDGVTLRKWLKDREHTWREVLDVMRDAGRGLAAAHAAGLVHRDFKPDNVLVGKDGRVRVMDFGLARLRPDDFNNVPALDRPIDVYSPLSASLTVAGTVVGTPAYMAPEVAAGATADALADQFSFGVALYEALYRARPFTKDAPPGTPPKPPPRTPVPARIQRVVLRALAGKPTDRYRSMDELLAELALDAFAKRRRWMIGGSVLAAIALAVGIGAVLASRARSEVCRGAERRLAGVWDPLTQANVRVAFEATKLPFAASAFFGLQKSLARYTGEWTSAVTEACEATRVRGEQTEEVLSLRQGCLDQRLAELRALTQLLATSDADLVQKGDKVVAGLEPINRCANVAALRAPGRPPTEPREKVEPLLDQLAQAKAALLAGHFLPSLVAAKKAADLADEIHYSPYKAEALVVRGASLTGAGNLEDSMVACQDAVWAAALGHRDDIIANASLCAAATAAQRNAGDAKIWIQMARVFSARLGKDPVFELRVLEVEGLVAAVQGDMNAALAAQQKAVVQAEQIYGRDATELWQEEEIVGTTFARIGAWAKAAPHLERGVQLREAAVGKNHPDIASMLTTLGACYSQTGDNAKARAAYERALSIKEAAEGRDNPSLSLTLNNMADGLIKAGDVTSALVYLERARQLAEARLGKDNPMYHAIETTHAEALVAAKRLDEARALFDEVIALETKTSSLFLAGTLNARARAEVGAKRWADAASFAQRAIAAQEASNGKDSPELWEPLYTLAHAYVELGRKSEARPLLERSIAIADKAQIDAKSIEPVRVLLGQLR